ncbi:MAG: DNA polymerase beta superfamily protein, partial [Polyangiaceae bacterium]
GLLEGSEFAALVRFARDKSAELDLPRELRPKNAYNLVRLLATATRWLREGVPTFTMEGALRDRLAAIKKGQVSLDEVLAEADGMAPELERARDASRLPKRPDVGRADALLRRIGEELARRWVRKEEGVFGKGSPMPPEVTWSE